MLPDGFIQLGHFIVRNEVPIYDEGAPIELERDAAGKPTGVKRRATEADLEDIVARCNKRIQDTGDEALIAIGHSKPNLLEEDQPEVVGFAKNFKLGTLGTKRVITATMRFFKDRFDKAMKFPRRSVEMWESGKYIDLIALLGTTSPDRDLGLLYCEKDSDKKLFNSLEYPTIEAVLEAIKNTDTWKKLQLNAGCASEHNTYIATSKEKTMDGVTPLPPAVRLAKCPSCGHEYKMEFAKVDDTKVAELSEKDRMERDSDRIRLAKLEERLAVSDKELSDTKRLYRRSLRERELIQLEAEGYMLDRAEELTEVQDQTDEQFASHVKRIRNRYQKSPVGQKVIRTAEDREGTQDGKVRLNKDTSRELAGYACRKNITFEQALQEFESGALNGVITK